MSNAPRRLELQEGTSRKFWEVSTRGPMLTVRFGRIGSDGQKKEKRLGTFADAEDERDRLVAEKLRKGYREIGAAASAATGNALLAQLDEAARQSELPLWDNARLTCGAMRATGFTWSTGEALVFEKIAYARGSDVIARYAYVYGRGTKQLGFLGHTAWLLTEDQLSEEIDDHTSRSRVTGVTVRFADDGPKAWIRPSGGIQKTFTAKVAGHKTTIKVELPSLRKVKVARAKLLSRVIPNEVVLYRLCDEMPRDRLFAAPAQLVKDAGLPRAAKVHLRYDDWQHVAADEPASSSPDLVAIAGALATRAAPPKLRGRPNGDWRQWLDSLLPLRSRGDADEWGTRDAS